MRDILALSQLFADLETRALDQIASAAVLKRVSRNEILFNEGDTARSFYVVGEGKIKVFKLSPDGKEQILMIAEPGDSVAEAALFAGGSYPASAQALEESQVVVVNRDRFVALLGQHPELAVNLIGRLSQLLRQMTRLVEGLSLTDVTTRLAHYLASKAPENRGKTYTVRLTDKKSVLASQLGTIPETLSRSLARLVRQKVIAIDGPTIDVLDAERLDEIAGAS